MAIILSCLITQIVHCRCLISPCAIEAEDRSRPTHSASLGLHIEKVVNLGSSVKVMGQSLNGNLILESSTPARSAFSSMTPSGDIRRLSSRKAAEAQLTTSTVNMNKLVTDILPATSRLFGIKQGVSAIAFRQAAIIGSAAKVVSGGSPWECVVPITLRAWDVTPNGNVVCLIGDRSDGHSIAPNIGASAPNLSLSMVYVSPQLFTPPALSKPFVLSVDGVKISMIRGFACLSSSYGLVIGSLELVSDRTNGIHEGLEELFKPVTVELFVIKLDNGSIGDHIPLTLGNGVNAAFGQIFRFGFDRAAIQMTKSQFAIVRLR